MKFVEMIDRLKQGQRFRRPGWEAGTLIMFKPREPGYTGSIVGSIIRLNAAADVEAFSATSADLDASDWTEAT